MRQSTFAAGAGPRTPLGELTALPDPLAGFGEVKEEREREGRGREGKRRTGEGRGGEGMEKSDAPSKNPGYVPDRTAVSKMSDFCLYTFSLTLLFLELKWN